jgi:hypothetical protein
MSKKYRLIHGIATAAASFLLLILLAPMATAQHEVEIEIAGPWDYVPDSNPNNIIIFSPVTYHSMIAFEGGDINDTANSAHHPLVAEAGIHQLTLTFNRSDCAASPPTPPLNKLYAIAADPPKIATVLANTGQRFAVSLPRPCWYESYSEARARIDTNLISGSTQENSYTTWMVFHYTVQNSVTTATLNVKNDSTPGVTTPWPLTFSQTFPPTRSAITLDMYFSSMMMENYTCDQHSADFFDIDVGPTFWNKSNVYRLFPELDHTRLQTNHYNYDQTVCPQAVTVATPLGSQIPNHIFAIRNLLTKEHTDEAKGLLTKLRSEAVEFWDGSALATVNQDIDAASHTIDIAAKGGGPCTEAVAAQLLRITLYLYDSRSPGRADCHKMQFNVANAIQ